MLQDVLLFFLPFVLFFLFWFYSKKATNNKNWREDLLILSNISIKGNLISIENIRDFKYGKTEFDYIEGYKSYLFKKEDIVGMDYILEPFMLGDRIAHPFLSFTLKDKRRIVISVEVRKVKNEDYYLSKTFFRYYELIYVIATEEDVIKLRTHKRFDDVYLFPIDAPKKFIQNLFVDMLLRAQKIQSSPEFYHPLTNSCTTNLINHANKFFDKKDRRPIITKTIVPGYTKGLLFDFNFVFHGKDHFKDFEYYKINDRALKCSENKNLSECIRKGIE
jgi:hypothetical protein